MYGKRILFERPRATKIERHVDNVWFTLVPSTPLRLIHKTQRNVVCLALSSKCKRQMDDDATNKSDNRAGPEAQKHTDNRPTGRGKPKLCHIGESVSWASFCVSLRKVY